MPIEAIDVVELEHPIIAYYQPEDEEWWKVEVRAIRTYILKDEVTNREDQIIEEALVRYLSAEDDPEGKQSRVAITWVRNEDVHVNPS